MSKNQQYLIKITVTAILAAAAMIINRFLSFNVWNMSIGISFVPVLVCGLLFGPLWGGVCGALADFIGALLFPFGPYFFGFTAKRRSAAFSTATSIWWQTPRKLHPDTMR